MGITIKPFKAVRPKPEYASKVAAPPYDVMNTEEARIAVKGNPYSFLHVDKPEIDLSPSTEPYSPEVYAKAKSNLQALMDVMVQDEHACLYIYRLTGFGQVQTGLAACVSVAEYEQGLIKKHEFTRPDKEQDRVDHMLACEAHTGPIFMAYRSSELEDASVCPSALMAELTKQTPVYDFVAEDGVMHELWVVSDQATQETLIQAFAQIPAIYIADGHHRNATALRVAQMRNAAIPGVDPEAAHNFYLAVIFPHNELTILDYNRVVADLNGLTISAFLDAVGTDWVVEKREVPVKPDRKHVVGMYITGEASNLAASTGQWYKLTLQNPAGASDIIGNLDCSALQERLLAPILGIGDPKTDKRIDFVGGARGLKELERRVDNGEMAVAFALYPTSMDELMAVADADYIMPPKSTWFEPKLRSGLLLHFYNDTSLPPCMN